MEAVTVSLPGGLRVSGDWHRDAVLRPLAGRDEAFLLQQGREFVGGLAHHGIAGALPQSPGFTAAP